MIKKLFFGSLVILGLVVFAGAFFGCGELETVQLTGLPGADGLDGVGCIVVGSLLTCADGTSFDLAGLDGKDGVDGEDGKDGLPGQDGKDGEDGKDGKNATLYIFPMTTACLEVGPGIFARRNGANAEIYRVISTTTACINPTPTPTPVPGCSGSKVCTLNQTADELCFIGTTMFVVDGGVSNMSLYKVLFEAGM